MYCCRDCASATETNVQLEEGLSGCDRCGKKTYPLIESRKSVSAYLGGPPIHSYRVFYCRECISAMERGRSIRWLITFVLVIFMVILMIIRFSR
jgi:hypothetical protein